MTPYDTIPVLDRAQLREVTLEDEELMRQILDALIEDTEKQIPLFHSAILALDGPQCAHLAHYCKGACANVGARSAVATLERLEHHARKGAMEECSRQLMVLSMEVDRLRAEQL